MPNDIISICPTCSKEFIKKNKVHSFCSRRCKTIFNCRKHYNEYFPKKYPKPIICRICGKEAQAKHSKQKYCSRECLHIGTWNYKTTPDRLTQLFIKQGNCCGICKKTTSNWTDLCIDHDHESGLVRGLLCRDCNIGLGLFRESLEITDNAAAYLARQIIPCKIAREELHNANRSS